MLLFCVRVYNTLRFVRDLDAQEIKRSYVMAIIHHYFITRCIIEVRNTDRRVPWLLYG